MSNQKEAGSQPDGEAMPAAERELAEDAQWKVIQKNTFTRWTNEHLKQCQKQVAELESDLSDGLRLIALVEVLSGKNFKHINKRPNFRSQKLENVSMALKFLEEDEGIKIVNIDSTDIVDSKLKLILGLIWTLILHYSISMPVWEGEEDDQQQQSKSAGKGHAKEGPTPKQRLLIWVQNRLPDLPVKNFTTDWNDGRAIGALVDAVGPGLCPDWQDWDPKQGKRNATEAMDLAEKWLDVPQLIRPEEMVSPHVDELSMMTYLSQFPSAKLKPEAPLRPRINHAKVRAYGPGLESESNRMSAPASFTVETFSAGRGEVAVTVVDSQGQHEPCEVVFNNDRNLTYNCVYVPRSEGEYTITITFAGKEIPKSPFKVLVQGAAGDASKVTARGPGLESHGVLCCHKTTFQVLTAGAGHGNVDVTIVDPHGRKDSTKAHLGSSIDGTVDVEYATKEHGQHTVHVYFAGAEIPGSPFTVIVALPVDAKKCLASGRGIQAKGVRVNDVADIKINTEGAGEAELKAWLDLPGGKEEPVIVKKLSSTKYEAQYVPSSVGTHTVHVTYGGNPIAKSPFKIDVASPSTNNVRAYGPGLKTGVVLRPAEFVVETNGEAGALGFAIEGPSETKIDCKDNGDGSADVSFVPSAAGEYAVHVLYNNEDIVGSPFLSQVVPSVSEFYPERVVVTGPGLDSSNAALGKPAVFSVNTAAAGTASLAVFACDTFGQPIDVAIVETKNDTTFCQFVPKKSGKHTVFVTFGGVNVSGSPFKVVVPEPSCPEKVKVFGPGIEKTVQLHELTHFFVDCSEAGPGDIAISLRDADGKDITVNATDDGFGLFRIEYEAKSYGKMVVNVLFADKEVPNSPYSVTVEPNVDVSLVKVENIQPTVPDPEASENSRTSERSFCKAETAASTAGVAERLVSSNCHEQASVQLTLSEQERVTDVEHYQEIVSADGLELSLATDLKKQAVPAGHSQSTMQPGSTSTSDVAELLSLENAVTLSASTAYGHGTIQNDIVSASTPAESTIVEDVAVQAASTAYDQSALQRDCSSINADIERPILENVVVQSALATFDQGAMHDNRTSASTGAGSLTLENATTQTAPTADGRSAVQDNGSSDTTSTERPALENAYISSPDAGVEEAAVIDEEIIEPVFGTVGESQPTFYDTEVQDAAVEEKETVEPISGTVGESRSTCLSADNLITERLANVSEEHAQERTEEFLHRAVDEIAVLSTGIDGNISIAPTVSSRFDLAHEEQGVVASEAAFVKAYGDGLACHALGSSAAFIVDASSAPSAGDIRLRLGVYAEGPAKLAMSLSDAGEGLCRVTYCATVPGSYTLTITYAGEAIPGSPWDIVVEHSDVVPSPAAPSTVDTWAVEVMATFVECEAAFVVDARPVRASFDGQRKDVVKALVITPSGQKQAATVIDNGDGTYAVSFVPHESGRHAVEVTIDGVPLPGTPLFIDAVDGNDPSRVKVEGPGLISGKTNQPQVFVVSTNSAGRGQLAVAVEGPSQANVSCVDNGNGTCTVTYIPTRAGTYDVSVQFGDKNIPGSPFKVAIEDVVDPSKCRAVGAGLNADGVRSRHPAAFTVDCTDAGVAELQVNVWSTDEHGSRSAVPASVEPVDDAVYQVTYIPNELTAASSEKADGSVVDPPLLSVEVLYSGQHVPGSPFKVRQLPSYDASLVRVSGAGIGDSDTAAVASLPASFVIDARDAGLADIAVTIQAPDSRYLSPAVTDNKDGTATVTFVPDEVGQYVADVQFGGKPVPGTPFAIDVVASGDASKCQIQAPGVQKRVTVGRECVITVNTVGAGSGNITCRIRTPSDADADIDIQDNGDGTVSIYYTPKTPGAYQISIKFGGITIPDGSYDVQAVSEEDALLAQEAELSASAVNELQAAAPGAAEPLRAVDLVIPVGPIFAFVTAEIHSPSGVISRPEIKDNGNGTITIYYQPAEVGRHQLYVYYNENNVQGSPYEFYVDAVDSNIVTAYGPGLSYGIAGQPCCFTVDTKNAGADGLAVTVEGPSKADISYAEGPEAGTCAVTYSPTDPGLYLVSVKVNGQHLSGSPFTAYVADNKTVAHPTTGTASEISLSVKEYDIASLSANIISPSGKQEPCILKTLTNGLLGISFVPRETGQHLVNVYQENGEHIANSPFKVNVTRGEVGDASKVKVYGDGLNEGNANQENFFTVDARDAGYGGLSLTVEGPSKAEIDCKDRPDGTCLVSYKPSEPGNYVINIKFADEHVPGSPFNCRIGGLATVKQTEELTAQQKAVEVSHVGSLCELSLKVPGSDPMEMLASVTSPSRITELCDIHDQSSEHYTIKFVPKEMGVHTVCVKHKGLHIPGSPFLFTVGPITDGGSHKVHAAGPGLERGEADMINEFNVYTREAGPGSLSINVEGPSKAEIHFEDKKDGSCVVGYTCTEPGEYLVSVKFNDEHIPDSPFRVPVLPHSGEARKLTVQSLRQNGLEVGRPCAFTVVFNGAHGSLHARVVAPSGARDEALVQPLDDTEGHYAVRFIPRENGVHYVHVLLDNNHIRGSPFRILVGECDPDPGLLTANGDGLIRGETDRQSKFFVTTLGAGASTLAVTVDGPSKVKLQAKEASDGYEFTYTPTAPGDYLISVKYGGNYHIAGSPFKAHVTGSGKPSSHTEQSHCVIETCKKVGEDTAKLLRFNSDASKVTTKGLGLNKAFIMKKAQFSVDASLAGNNMLFVGVVGPAGAPPCDEIVIKNAGGPSQFTVSYTLKTKGKYLLVVKYGDEHVPGSPFHVDVV